MPITDDAIRTRMKARFRSQVAATQEQVADRLVELHDAYVDASTFEVEPADDGGVTIKIIGHRPTLQALKQFAKATQDALDGARRAFRDPDEFGGG